VANWWPIFCRTPWKTGVSSELPARKPASPNTCVNLLTGGLLVRIQPEEPIFSITYGDLSFCRLANSWPINTKASAAAIDPYFLDSQILRNFARLPLQRGRITDEHPVRKREDCCAMRRCRYTRSRVRGGSRGVYRFRAASPIKSRSPLTIADSAHPGWRRDDSTSKVS
jgi:hypothetical protein